MTRVGSDFFLREYSMKHGHDPGWTISEFFRLARKYRPQRIYVEAVAYQRTLAWLLRQAMATQRQYYVIEEITDRRSKYQRILDGLSGPASNGHLFIKKNHEDFLQQYNDYPNVSHDDVIETVAVGCEKLSGLSASDPAESWADIMSDEDEMPRLEYHRGAP